MSQHEPITSNQANPTNGDGCADALATIVIIALVVSTVVFWLHGMPT